MTSGVAGDEAAGECEQQAKIQTELTAYKMLLQLLLQMLNPRQNLFCHLLCNPCIFAKVNDCLHIGQTLQKCSAP